MNIRALMRLPVFTPSFRPALRWWRSAARNIPSRITEVTATLEANEPCAQVPQHFLSFSIDISVLAGGFWWEGCNESRRGLGTLRIPPLPLDDKKLDRLVSALGPAVLRVGGSEADKIHYFEAPPEGDPDSLVLTQEMWDDLHDFIRRNQLSLAFTVKYGLFQKRLHGEWCAQEVEKLLRYSWERGYAIDYCELGNELNAYWAFHGLRSQPRATHLALDYHRFAQVVHSYFPRTKIIGPGSAFWPKLGETIKPFSNLTRKFLESCQQQGTPLDIVDWHYYPFQSLRSPVRTRTATTASMLNPKALNDFQKYSRQLCQWRDGFFPEAQLWTGETGSAQCGGQPKLSDRFISCFWWADQLAAGAAMGQQVMVRQSLIGGDYGLIDRLTLKPRPDYWLSWLWKQLMGGQVYPVASNHTQLRAYCHSAPEGEGKTLLLINLSATPMRVQATGFGYLTAQYTLSAKRLASRKVRINGKRARYRKGQFSLTDFPVLALSPVLPKHSIGFWQYQPEPKPTP